MGEMFAESKCGSRFFGAKKSAPAKITFLVNFQKSSEIVRFLRCGPVLSAAFVSLKLSWSTRFRRGTLVANSFDASRCYRSTSPPGGNQVDGLPPAVSRQNPAES